MRPDADEEIREGVLSVIILCIHPLCFDTPPLRVLRKANNILKSVGVNLRSELRAPISLDEIESLHVLLQCATVYKFCKDVCHIVSTENLHKDKVIGSDSTLNP